MRSSIVPAGMLLSIVLSPAFVRAQAISSGLSYYSVTPCRVIDTRDSNMAAPFGPPALASGAVRWFPITTSSKCGIPAFANAYSVNATVVPHGFFGWLRMWAAGDPTPEVSTLNSYDGSVIANGAVVAAGTGGAISVQTDGDTDLIVDINGYFASPGFGGQTVYRPMDYTCRYVDTRHSSILSSPPPLSAYTPRTFSLNITGCGVIAAPEAYALNLTVVPNGPLGYVSAWADGQAWPGISTLNSYDGRVIANGAIVPTNSGGVTVEATNAADVIIDVSGFFSSPDSITPGIPTGLYFRTLPACRIVDTRLPDATFGGPSLSPNQPRNFPLRSSGCNIPSSAQAYSLNITAVPKGFLGWLSVWRGGTPWQRVSTLNAYNGLPIANSAFVGAGTDGSISVQASNATDVVIDINGYFEP